MKSFQILATLVVLLGVARADVTISHAQIGNVDAGQFCVLWQVDDATVPRVDIFADAGGATSLNGQLGVELYPLEMHDISVPQTTADRLARRTLQAATQAKGIVMAKVVGAVPGTTYYVRPRSFSAGGTANETVLAPLLPVTTAAQTSFVIESRQLRVGFGGCFAGSDGLVMKLTLAGAPSPLFAVVGDYGLPEQALFDLSRLLNAAGTTNANLSGTPQLTIELYGPTAPAGSTVTDVPYSNEPIVAQLTDTVFFANFPGLAYFSLEAVNTPLQGVPFVFNVTARTADGSVLTSYSGNVDLSTSGGENDLFEGGGATPSFSNGVLANYQVIPAVTGGVTFTATRPCGSETGSQLFNFAALNVANWRQHHFGADAGSEEIAGFAADADHDGLLNGLEYFFGIDPLASNITPIQDALLDENGDEFIFDYWRARLAPGVSSRTEWAETMPMWRRDLVSEEVVETVGAYQKVRVRVPSAGLSRVFGRVVVSAIP